MKLRRPGAEPDDLDMTPMIDVVFQLVLFFMIGASFTDDAFIRVVAPRAERPERVAVERAFMVQVAAGGAVASAGPQGAAARYESLAALVRDLEGYARACRAAGRDPVAVVRGDRDARYQDVVLVWNAIRKAGVAEVNFQVAPER